MNVCKGDNLHFQTVLLKLLLPPLHHKPSLSVQYLIMKVWNSPGHSGWHCSPLERPRSTLKHTNNSINILVYEEIYMENKSRAWCKTTVICYMNKVVTMVLHQVVEIHCRSIIRLMGGSKLRTRVITGPRYKSGVHYLYQLRHL